MNELTPTYLEADFQSLKTKLISVLKTNSLFRDYNFEGANITMLIELLSYVAELNTYYVNKLAKNMFLDTTEVYETASLMANLRGYYPKGYISPKVTLNVTVDVHEYLPTIPNPGDQIYIPKYYPFKTGLTYEDEEIVYVTPKDYTFSIPTSAVDSETFEIELKQGSIETLSYTGEDIINGVIYLPFFTFDNDTAPYEEASSIVVYVNGVPWTRVENFIDDYSNLEDDNNVYRFEYNKFQEYCLRFSTAHNIPKTTDQIKIFVLKTLGTNGNIASYSITEFENIENIPYFNNNDFAYQDSYFVKNITKDYGVSLNNIEVENPEASYGGAMPETINEIVSNSTSTLQSQYRNITKNDYNSYLEEHADIIKANCWGENEINPYNTQEYNKVYVSLIPATWGTSTISTEPSSWTITEGLSAEILLPNEYSTTFVNKIKEYLEPKKFLNTFEYFTLPELVYFVFDIGIKVKRLYNYTNVKNDVEAKLQYFFETNKRNFNEVIDFKEIHNYILNTTIKSDSNTFSNVRGIDSLVIRDITTFTPSISGDSTIIYEPNDERLYPQYTKPIYDATTDNILRPIELGFNQFPILIVDGCTYENEG